VLHNDYSEREFQLEKGGQWVKGKSADTFAPIGPHLVTPDEIDDVNDVLTSQAQEKIADQLKGKIVTMDLDHDNWIGNAGEVLNKPKTNTIILFTLLGYEVKPPISEV